MLNRGDIYGDGVNVRRGWKLWLTQLAFACPSRYERLWATG